MSRFDPMPREDWAACLAVLMCPHDPAMCKRALVQFIGHVGLPPEAYTRGSLDAVASHKRRMSIPAFDEFAAPMREWWKENRPIGIPLLAGPASQAPQPLPGDAEKAAVTKALTNWRQEQASSPAFDQVTPRPKPRYLDGEQLRHARLAAGIREKRDV